MVPMARARRAQLLYAISGSLRVVAADGVPCPPWHTELSEPLEGRQTVVGTEVLHTEKRDAATWLCTAWLGSTSRWHRG